MPLNSVKLYSKQGYYEDVYEDLENTLEPNLTETVEPPPSTEPEQDGNFSRGLSAGIDQTQALGGGLKALAGSILNKEDWVEDGMAYYQEQMAEAEQNAGDVMTIEEIDSINDFGAWSAYTLGTLVPDLAGAVATMGLGSTVAKAGAKAAIKKTAEEYAKSGRDELVKQGMEKEAADKIAAEVAEQYAEAKAKQYAVRGGTAGAIAYGTGQGSGNTFAQTLLDTGEEAPYISLTSGLAQGSLNAIPAFKVLTDIIPANLRDDAVQVIQEGVNQPWVGQYLRDVGATAGLEGLTEGLQYIIEQETIAYVNNNFTKNEAVQYFDYISNEKKRSGLINSTAAGFLGGSVTGAGGATVKKIRGGYDPDLPDFDSMRDVTPDQSPQERRQFIADTFNRYRDGTTITTVDDDGRMVGTSVAELVPNPKQQQHIDEVVEQLQSQYGEAYDPSRLGVELGEGDDVSVTYTESDGMTSLGRSESAADVQPVDDIVTDFTSAPSFGARDVSQGTREYGNDHRWDAPLADATKPVQDQLLELSAIAQTPEALDPSNTEVVIEPIDQDDVDRVFDRNETLKIGTRARPKGKSLPTIEETYGDKSESVTNTVAGVMADLSKQGVPVKFIDSVSGVFVHTDDDVDAPALTGKGSRGISINTKLVDGAMADQAQLSELAWTMTHEVYHAADYAYGLSDKDARFGITIEEDSDQPRVVMGDVMEEIFDNWEKATPLGKRFDYPFNDLADDIQDLEKSNKNLNIAYREEVFAQLGALFHSNPKQLQQYAPEAYNYIKDIRDNNLQAAQVEVQDEQSSSPVTTETTQPSGISGEVRAPPESRGEQIVQPESTGPDGEGGAGEGRADTPVAGSEQDESGQRQRPEVQESVVAEAPITYEKIKRGESFATDGTYDVTYPDGTVYQIYRDAVTNPSQPTWNLDPSNYDLLGLSSQDPARVMGVGSTRKEALAWLDLRVNEKALADKDKAEQFTEENIASKQQSGKPAAKTGDKKYETVESRPEKKAGERDEAVKIQRDGEEVAPMDQAKNDVSDQIDETSYIKKKQRNKALKKLDDGTPSTNKFTYNDEIDSQSDLARRLKGKKIYRSLVDRYARLEDFEQQAAEYLELGRLPAAISPRDQENLSHGRVQLDLDEFHEKHVDPIGDLIAELGYTVEAVDIYLIAKHAAERNDAIAEKVKDQRARNIQRVENQILKLQEDVEADHSVQISNLMEKLNQYDELPLAFQDTGSGMTYDEAQTVLDLAEEEGTKADMERIAQKVYDMLGEYRRRMVTSGLLDDDTRADWEDRFEFYVPLKGFAAEEDGDTYTRNSTSRGFSVVGRESMKAKGRKTLPFSPLLTSFEDVQKKIIRARKNEYAQTLLDLLSELGNSESYTIYNTQFRPMKESDELTQQDLREMSLDVRPNGDPKYVEVKRDGQTFFIYFESDALNHTLQNMSVPMLSRANESMGKLLTLATRFQTFRRNMLINYNPTWGMVNPLRDVQTGMMYALGEMDKKGSRVQGENLVGKMAQSYLPSMRALWRNYRGKPVREGNEMDVYVREYVEDGGPTGMMLMKDADEQLRILKNKIKRGTVRDLLKGMGKFVEDFNTTMENSIRFAAYVEARKAGAPREDAATLSKDLTVNFNRKGEDTAVINAGYLFFNAAVQGNMNILQAMADDGGKGSKKTTTARKAALGMVAIGSALALFNILSSEDDDDDELIYDDLPEHAKNRSLLFMWSKDEGFALPAPYGYNFFTNIGRLSTELAMGVNDEKETAQYLWENFLLNFVPVAPAAGDGWEDAARGFYPDLLEVHLDMLANKNFFGSDIFIEQNPLFVERSAAYNARRSTDKMFTVPAQFLNDVTGGDKYKDGWVAINPDKMQYVYEYFLGGVGRFASQTTDVTGRMLADEEFRKQDLPIVGAFFESPSEYEDRFEFYANWEETRKIVTRFKEAANMEEVRALQKEYKPYLPLLEPRYGGKNLYQLSNRDLRRISKSRKMIERQNYGGAELGEIKRRELLDQLEAEENKIFDIFNAAYRAAEKQ